MSREILKGVMIAVITAAILGIGSLLSGDRILRLLGGVTQHDGKLFIGDSCYSQRELVRCAIRGRLDHLRRTMQLSVLVQASKASMRVPSNS